MEDLRELFRALGSEDVRTYVQSGNVVFRSRAPSSDLTSAIQDRMREALDLDVTLLLRTKAELARVVRGNPFLPSGIEPAKLHVTFLSRAPDAARLHDLGEKRFEPEQFAGIGREIYLHCPNGYGRTKLGNTFLERQLSVAATTRNWRTVTTLLELANER
jgi:uncharacterized protein (DUF1697 family)